MKKILQRIRSVVGNRMLWTATVVLVIFCLLVHTLYTMQVLNADTYKEKMYADTVEEVRVDGVRGNIYDCYGRPLAQNVATQSLYFRADEAGKDLNESIYSLLAIMEENGDELAVAQSLPIAYDPYSGFYYSGRYANPNSKARPNFLAEIYGTKRDDLTPEQAGASAEQAYYQMRDTTFKIDDSLSIEETLKVMLIRYAIFQARWSPEEPVLIAQDISEGTQVSVLEQNDEYKGFYVETEYSRVYPQGEIFSHILGYVGRVSEAELEEYGDLGYSENDFIGKTGLEAVYESELRGDSGMMEVTFSGRTGERLREDMLVAAKKGNDIILTIDTDFQRECYQVLYHQIKILLLEKLTGTSGKLSYSAMDVLCALLKNGFFNIDTIKKSDNSVAQAYVAAFNQEADQVITELKDLILNSSSHIDTYSDETMDYFDLVMRYMRSESYLSTEYRDEQDPEYVDYLNGWTSAREFLGHCYDKGYFAMGEFGLEVTVPTDEGLAVILDTVLPALRHEESFEQMVFTYVLRNGLIGSDSFISMCYDLGFLDNEDGSYDDYRSGNLSLLQLIRNKIWDDEITPGDINLDPSSGSLIVTDCNSGEVRAIVSYPSYDNNRFMNNAAYNQKVINDNSSPMLFRALMETRAPGSTFKMCTASAGLELGYITTSYYVYDNYRYENVNSAAKPTCWSTVSHGYINIVEAIRDSCNYFFYDLGYRMSDPDPETGEFSDQVGLQKLAYYAETLGLSTRTGIELNEATPSVSTQDAVRSAIGQGTNAYTVANINRYTNTVANGGTVYDLFLVKRLQDADGMILEETAPKAVSKADVSEENFDIIKRGMRLVNTESSVDTLGELDELGITTAGKTGTAEESRLRAEHSWYTGYTNYENPEISITINIPYGNGSDNATPVFRDVVKAYYDLDE